MKVKDFILSNKNRCVKWEIDDETFTDTNNIPKYIMEKFLYEWTVNQWEGIILLMTYVS